MLTHIGVSRAGQHLLSAIADEVLGADTASWELHSRSQDGDAAGTADEAISVELEAASVTAAQILVGIALTLALYKPYPPLPYPTLPCPTRGCSGDCADPDGRTLHSVPPCTTYSADAREFAGS